MSRLMSGRVGFQILFGLASLILATTARADLMTTYTVRIDANASDVTGIVVGERLQGGVQRVVFDFTAPAGESTQITPRLPIAALPLGSVLLGVIEDSTVFGGGDVVLMISNASAALVEGKSWERLFPYTREADVAASLIYMASDASLDEKFDTILFIQTFIKDSLGIGYWDPQSQLLVPYMFQVGDSFSVLSFSDGKRIGSGTSRVLGGAVVPEASSASLLAIGAVAIGGLTLRRRAGFRMWGSRS